MSTPNSVTDPIRLGTRGSALARAQSAVIGDALADVSGSTWREVIIRTSGDDTALSLNQPGSPGLFVAALRKALVDGVVDVIVHSYKDLPSAPAAGITVAAIPVREDSRDALVSHGDCRLQDLPAGAVVGTSSPRRAAAIRAVRPDLAVKPIRGNVDTRIRKVREGEYDATVLALAGLRRIGRENEIAQVFSMDELLPAPAQGALAVECRADDAAMITALRALDDPASRLVTAAEREVLVGIGASCTTAVAAAAVFSDGRLTLRAALVNEHGVAHSEATRTAVMAVDDVMSARVLGMRTAADLLGDPDSSPVLLVRSDGNERDAASLIADGVAVVCDPYVRIEPVQSPGLLDVIEANPDCWLLVSSPMTIPSWAASVGEDMLRSTLTGRRAAATGERTADTLRTFGCAEVLVSKEPSAQGLVAAMSQIDPGIAVFPKGDLALPTVPDGLRELGWQVIEAIVYKTSTVEHIPASVALIRERGVAAIVFRSPSAVRALTAFVTPDPSIPIICGGATTAAAARAAGLEVAMVAASPSSESVAAAVAQVMRGH